MRLAFDTVVAGDRHRVRGAAVVHIDPDLRTADCVVRDRAAGDALNENSIGGSVEIGSCSGIAEIADRVSLDGTVSAQNGNRVGVADGISHHGIVVEGRGSGSPVGFKSLRSVNEGRVAHGDCKRQSGIILGQDPGAISGRRAWRRTGFKLVLDRHASQRRKRILDQDADDYRVAGWDVVAGVIKSQTVERDGHPACDHDLRGKLRSEPEKREDVQAGCVRHKSARGRNQNGIAAVPVRHTFTVSSIC